MNTFVNTFLLVYAALFPIVNPFGSAPFFLSLTDQYTNIERARIARQIAINSFLLLLGSLLIGSHVLGFFGVSLPIVRVAGGLVVTAGSCSIPRRRRSTNTTRNRPRRTTIPIRSIR